MVQEGSYEEECDFFGVVGWNMVETQRTPLFRRREGRKEQMRVEPTCAERYEGGSIRQRYSVS